METISLILIYLVTAVFLFSGINKAYFDMQTLVKKGQTGVENLPSWFIKFIGVAEIIGSIGLISSIYFEKIGFLRPYTSLALGFIMIPAAIIHFRKKEFKSVIINCILLTICILIAVYHQ